MGRLRHLYADLAVSLTAARARSMSEAGKGAARGLACSLFAHILIMNRSMVLVQFVASAGDLRYPQLPSLRSSSWQPSLPQTSCPCSL